MSSLTGRFRIFHDDYLSLAATTILQTSLGGTSPYVLANIQNQHRHKIWRTGTVSTTESFQVDLASAKHVTAFIILDHDLKAGDVVTLKANSSSSFGAAPYSVTPGFTVGSPLLFTLSEIYRYWQVSITKTSSAETRQMSRVYLGNYYSTNELPDYEGFTRDGDDFTTVLRSDGGQEYPIVREQRRIFKVDFSAITRVNAEDISAVAEAVGKHTNVFMQIDKDATQELGELLYVKFADLPKWKVDGMDTDLTFSGSIEFREAI